MGNSIKNESNEDCECYDKEYETFTSYELFLYYKQGDDFAHALKETNHNISDALNLWSQHLKNASEHATKLANLFAGKNITTNVDTNHISFHTEDNEVEKLFEHCVKEELLSKHDYND